ncbi:PKD domain-containing protein, partial [Pseudaeromonas pectinilytica]
MMTRHEYPTFWRIGLMALLALFMTACGGGGGDNPAPPVAELTASFTQQVSGLEVNLDASGSTENIASYQWDFGDGSSGVGKTVSHTYAAAGDYSVVLTVTDDKGATASQSVSVSVVAPNVAPTAAFSHGAKELVASFDASASSDIDGSIASYSWNFGDGATGTGKSASHSYAAAGTYTVTLTVTDDQGATASKSASISVLKANVAPTAAFSHSAKELVASFDASASSDSDGSIASYSWNFGDGATGTGKSASHSYAA